MSSSTRPPQLQLSLPPHTTSFKRSFEQFGFDLESPSAPDASGASGSGSQNGTAGSPPGDGNDRSKRPRSSSRSVESPESPEHSHSGGASPSSSADAQRSALSATRPAVLNESAPIINAFLDPPRLPTPDLPDVEMIDYQAEETSLSFRPPPAPALSASDRLRLSLDRFNAFDSQISVIRGSRPRSPPAVQSPSPPPTLPPLSLSLDDRGGLNPLPNPFAFNPAEPSSSSSHAYLTFGSPGSMRSGVDPRGLNHPGNHMTLHELNGDANPDRRDPSPSIFPFISHASLSSDEHSSDSLFPMAENGHPGPSLARPGQQRDETNPFRDRLDSALDIIRSHSPLFSEFNDESPPRRTEDVRFAPLPRIRTQVDEDRSWGVPWFNHPPDNTSDLFGQADGYVGSSRSSTSPTAFLPPPVPRLESSRDPSPPARSAFLGRARRPERDTHGTTSPDRTQGSSYGAVLVNLERAQRDADAYLVQLADLRAGPRRGNGNATRTSSWEDSSSDTDRFIANGLLDPNEENSHRRSFEPHSGGPRSSNTSPLHHRRSWGHRIFRHPGERSDEADIFDQDQPLWWPSTLRRAMQSRYTHRDAWTRPSAHGTRLMDHESPSTSPTEQRPSSMIWQRYLSSTNSSRDQLDEPTSPRFSVRNGPPRRWSLSSSRQSGDSNPSESESRGETRSSVVATNPSSADATFSSSSDEDDGWFPIIRYPFNFNSSWDGRPGQDTAPQSVVPSRTPRGLPVDADTQETIYPWLDLADSRTDRDNPVLPSRLSWSSQRRFSMPRAHVPNRSSSSLFDGAPQFPEFHLPTDRMRRSSAASEHSGFWNTSNTTIQQHTTGSEAETSPTQDDLWTGYPSAGSSRPSAVRDRLPRPRRPPSPPRVPFSLPTPDFSPVFEPLEGMDASPPVSPHREAHMGPQSWRRTSVNGSENTFRLSSPPPVWEARPRQPSPLRLPMPRDMPRNSSINRNIDLNAYTDGPFRTSLQRFMEPDRVRPRFSRTESMTANEMGPGPSQPPSLPPLRFDYQLLPLNLNSPMDLPHASTSTQTRASSSSSPEHRMGGSFEERRANVRFHADQRLRENLRRRAPSPPPVERHIPPIPAPPSVIYQPPPTSGERRDSIFSGIPRFVPWRNERERERERERELASRSHVIDPDLVMSHTRRDVFGRSASQAADELREPAEWVGWGDMEGGEAEAPRMSPLRRRFGRRSQDVPRSERLFPDPPLLAAAASSSSRPAVPGPPPAAGRRQVSRSPTRDDESLRDRIRFVTRTGIRNFRFRINQEDHSFGLRSRFAGDYVRDEDFDTSYESLLSLAATLGEVKPRVVPEHVLSSLPTGRYREWASSDSDKRCPICLEDYKPIDFVMKLTDCGHWLHKDCLKQWLRGACTCPVCRKNVREPRQPISSEDPGPTSSSSGRHRHREEGSESPLRRVSWAH